MAPRNVSPLACVAASVVVGELIGVGTAGLVGGVYFFTHVTLPAFKKDWGLP